VLFLDSKELVCSVDQVGFQRQKMNIWCTRSL